MLQPSERSCETCGDTFIPHYKNINKPKKGRFCSISCSSKRQRYWTKIPNVICSYCDKPFYKCKSKQLTSRSGHYFCCRQHRDLALRVGTAKTIEAIQPLRYRGQECVAYDYRIVALRHYKPICHRCDFKQKPEILIVHHKDRDRSNNLLDNLEILCPNCHATEHYGE